MQILFHYIHNYSSCLCDKDILSARFATDTPNNMVPYHNKGKPFIFPYHSVHQHYTYKIRNLNNNLGFYYAFSFVPR